jgi:hypothetical protein
MLFENEVAQHMCKVMKGLERPSLYDINDIIASTLVPTLLPKYSSTDLNQNNLKYSHFSDDIQHLCCHSGYKFIEAKSYPQTKEESISYTQDSWSSLLNAIIRLQSRGIYTDRSINSFPTSKLHRQSTSNSNPNFTSLSITSPNKDMDLVSDKSPHTRFIASVLTLHGQDSQAAVSTIQTGHKLARPTASSPVFSDGRNPQSELLYSIPHESIVQPSVVLNHSPRGVNGYDRSISLLSNNNSMLPLLQRIVGRAAELYRLKAYVHQYAPYGVQEDQFVDSFRRVGQVIANYRDL